MCRYCSPILWSIWFCMSRTTHSVFISVNPKFNDLCETKWTEKWKIITLTLYHHKMIFYRCSRKSLFVIPLNVVRTSEISLNHLESLRKQNYILTISCEAIFVPLCKWICFSQEIINSLSGHFRYIQNSHFTNLRFFLSFRLNGKNLFLVKKKNPRKKKKWFNVLPLPLFKWLWFKSLAASLFL